MNPVSVDVKNILVAQSIGSFAATSGWAIYIGHQEAKPDTMITIYDTGGIQEQMQLDPTANQVRHPTFQVRVRGNTYTDVHTKMEAIREELKKRTPFTVGTVRYSGFTPLGDPISLGMDENNRHQWVQSFACLRQETT